MSEDIVYWSLMISTFLLSYAIAENLYLRRKIKRLKVDADKWNQIFRSHRDELRNLVNEQSTRRVKGSTHE